MNTKLASRNSLLILTSALLGLWALPTAAQAQWHATAGAQSPDQARQALAFLPNEMWIHAGDSVTWTVETGEIHTVTFLKAGQPRPPFPVGCSAVTPSGSAFDGTSCVGTPPMVKGQTFTVTFPQEGNFKLVCLVHEDMTGLIHVLNDGAALPYDQKFYDREAAVQRRALLADRDADATHHHGDSDDGGEGAQVTHVMVGMGEITATTGGHQALSVMRFDEPVITIHAGDTVEWGNVDPITPHTITFGTEPANPMPPSSNVTVEADGALHAVVASTSDSVHSGFILAEPQERIGLPQALPGTTRFRVTFPVPGVFDYKCALHDNLGMVGRVIVLH
ncbi:MAG: cupredoxin domain-containing protein [Terriglobales bacterium]